MQNGAEQLRLDDDLKQRQAGRTLAWRRWGPYLSERQWGTVREDYSAGGTAWDSFPHDHARSRAYRWGEDGLAGFSDDRQRLCLGVALWNGRDPILKERLFGLTNSEGNHGEDVKELYYYLDASPTHSYLKMLYKYPQREFPYAQLAEENRRRGKDQPEFELLDTGAFDENRYFDVFVEYAKAAADDILIQITVHNRGPDAAQIHVLPQTWLRNTWSWDRKEKGNSKPGLRALGGEDRAGASGLEIRHPSLGDYTLHFEGAPELLFTENETNTQRVFGFDGGPGYFKDAFHEYVVQGRREAVNPARQGTKAAAHFQASIAAGGSATFRARLSPRGEAAASDGVDSRPQSKTQNSKSKVASPFADFASILEARRGEADEFYAALQREMPDADARLVQRQALAGMIWNKQFYYYDVPQWMRGDAGQPTPPHGRHHGRNHEWQHLNNADVISMPDKWEYPWYAAWDLAFHMIPLALIDPEFAKDQLVLLTREWYMHPNGQLPAYEWAFGDVNPPVHAWATWRVFQMDRKQRRLRGQADDAGDVAFLERVFHKLMLNFTWWVNRKDAQGRNIFQGGFLGLDNIGVFDRSAPLPTGGFINQADGTSWMAMYCLNLMRIALELAQHNRVYEDVATKFFEHFLHIAEAMNNVGTDDPCDAHGVGLWSEEDQFYYDVLNLPNGQTVPLKVRSMVGLIPLFAVEVLEPELLDRLPEFKRRLEWFLNYRPDLAALVSHWEVPGRGERRLLSLLRGHRMKALLGRMLDENEFLSDYGVRSISRVHRERPYEYPLNGHTLTVRYQPAESDSGAFGGNSNWRGPVWMPVNYLLVESLQKFHHYYGDDFKVECPAGSGKFASILEVSEELTRRLTRPFRQAGDAPRPVAGDWHNLSGSEGVAASENADATHRARLKQMQNDPHFRDYVLFHEYFDGDTGRGVGASHQCGWTGVVAKLLAPRAPARASSRATPVAATASAVRTKSPGAQPAGVPTPSR